jgi:hypothetical protein
MNKIKEFFNYLDYLVGTFWGITVYDLLPQIGTGTLISSFDGVVKTLFALIGLMYACARLITYIIMSRLNKRYREQEIIEKENSNFYHKFNDEFLKNKKNGNE